MPDHAGHSANEGLSSSRGFLDPIERSSEIMFGLIMALRRCSLTRSAKAQGSGRRRVNYTPLTDGTGKLTGALFVGVSK